MIARIVSILTVTVLVALSATGAHAASQVLAVLSDQSGIPFVCTAGECRAELTTYCLQKERDTPRPGEAYRPGRATDFALHVTGRDGVARRLPVEGNVTFRSNRAFMSSVAIISAPEIERHGIVVAKLTVARDAALVPEPLPGDTNPLSPGEIETATGALRQIGHRIVDGSDNADAARVLMRASTRFAETGAQRGAELPKIWEFVRAEMGRPVGDGLGMDIAQDAYARCHAAAATNPFQPKGATGGVTPDATEVALSMLRCLRSSHDSLIRDANVTYWNSLAGS